MKSDFVLSQRTTTADKFRFSLMADIGTHSAVFACPNDDATMTLTSLLGFVPDDQCKKLPKSAAGIERGRTKNN